MPLSVIAHWARSPTSAGFPAWWAPGAVVPRAGESCFCRRPVACECRLVLWVAMLVHKPWVWIPKSLLTIMGLSRVLMGRLGTCRCPRQSTRRL